MSVNSKENLTLNLSHLAFRLAMRETMNPSRKGLLCVLGLTQPVNYKFQALECESQICEHMSNTLGYKQHVDTCRHMPFGVLEDMMSKEHSILTISALGLLALSVRLL